MTSRLIRNFRTALFPAPRSCSRAWAGCILPSPNPNHSEVAVRLAVKLYVEMEDDYVIGPGKMELLRSVQEQGSLLQAAQKMGMSYRWAWGRIQKTQAALNIPLLVKCSERIPGRPNCLTPEAKEILCWYRQAEEKLSAVLAEIQADMPELLQKR